ncbi:NUDIX hydrolase [Nocardioides lianchengensis]|uniref:ADP-ribose pyrophosphatase YjhB, NUDIX family n=1 Tax=Nocardioides lianchengensis TaxID=1045774 RepID=A0A1G6TX61_9ACTN|nr:NUDIX domain-containing protein [Nocardioides lianchengensis]NYG11604.1 ADP-ribose pyrophosphatase YjhB (NUDIX family) [Nocardioides lianchengensis]SDD33762.1 ADP-ribose pyrophosphatase YjhB, NUDIX family [Nocardioides lianchengensis]
MRSLPRERRLAAYAVVLRDDRILLSRLAPRVSESEVWTLPGGGVEHGEDPRDAVVRELHEETGLDVRVGEEIRVDSFHQGSAWREGRRVDVHSVRLVYEGWVPRDAPAPRVVEVDGSTVDAAWHPVSAVLDGTLPTVPLVRQALHRHEPFRLQRLAAYAVVLRGDDVLLTRISARGFHSGRWTLPGGGVDHGEAPRDALVREVGEECGVACTVGEVLDVHDEHFEGTAPSGRHEDFHAVHLVFAATVPVDAEPRVTEADGTTDAVAWVPVADVSSGAVDALDVVRAGLAAAARRTA